MPLLTTDCRGQPCLQWKPSLVGMPISPPFRSQSHSSWHLQAAKSERGGTGPLFSSGFTLVQRCSSSRKSSDLTPGRSTALPNFPQIQFAVAHCHWQQLFWLRSPTLGCAHGIQGNLLRGVDNICSRLQSFSVPTKRAVNVMVAAPLSVKMQDGCAIEWLIPTQGGHLWRNPAQQLLGQSFHSTPGFSLASATGPRLPDILKRCEKVLFVCLFCFVLFCFVLFCLFVLFVGCLFVCFAWLGLVWFGLFVCVCVCVLVWGYMCFIFDRTVCTLLSWWCVFGLRTGLLSSRWFHRQLFWACLNMFG